MVLDSLDAVLPVTREAIQAGLEQVQLPGRFQVIPGEVEMVLDVAHNPAGAQVLARSLEQYPCSGRTLALFAMLEGKAVEEVAQTLVPLVSAWYLGGLETERALSPGELQHRLVASGVTAPCQGFKTLAAAYRAAREAAQPGDRLLVFGSFYTVAGILGLLSTESQL
jgi:dihydrofolate synthase/folylpolyglutamate synthase